MFTTNQITSALVAYRSAADQDTATALLLAGQARSHGGGLGAAGRRRGRRGGGRHRRADPGPHGRLAVKLDGCSVVLATHTAGVSVDGYTLTLAANPWNIARTYNLTPGRELLFACRNRLGTASHCTAASRETRAPGARPRCTSQCLRTELQSCTSVRTSRRRACPTRRLERWTSTASRSWTQPWRPATRRRRRRTRRPRRSC